MNDLIHGQPTKAATDGPKKLKLAEALGYQRAMIENAKKELDNQRMMAVQDSVRNAQMQMQAGVQAMAAKKDLMDFMAQAQSQMQRLQGSMMQNNPPPLTLYPPLPGQGVYPPLSGQEEVPPDMPSPGMPPPGMPSPGMGQGMLPDQSIPMGAPPFGG